MHSGLQSDGIEGLSDLTRQNISSGSGNQFPGSTFTGPVRFNSSLTWNQRRVRFVKDLQAPKYLDQKNFIEERVKGTCEWCISHKIFQDWCDDEPPGILWISADPGCGKSVLARHLIDEVLPARDISSKDTSEILTYFFFKDGPTDQSTVTSALRALLHQVFRQLSNLPTEKDLERYEMMGPNLLDSFSELWDILQTTAREAEGFRIICVLDALDECEEKGRDQFINALKKIQSSAAASSLKFLITSRPYEYISGPFNSPSLRVIHLSGDAEPEKRKMEHEIELVAKDRMEKLVRKHCLGQNVRDIMSKRLCGELNRTYLWIDVILRHIEKDVRPLNSQTISTAMSELPEEMDELYNSILQRRFKDSLARSEGAKDLLQLVATAARPLAQAELRAALELKDSRWSMPTTEGEESDTYFSQTIRNMSGLLLSLNGGKVHLFHRTVREFLMERNESVQNSPPISSSSLVWRRCLSPPESHRMLAKICIKILLDLPIQDHDEEFREPAFFDYAAKHWASHVSTLNFKEQSSLTEDILVICDPRLAAFSRWFPRYWTDKATVKPEGFTRLITLAYFGLVGAVQEILNSDLEGLNEQDETCRRPVLSWALVNGHTDVAHLLIGTRKAWDFLSKKRLQLNLTDERRRSPLIYAVWLGDLPVVSALLDAGARVDLADNLAATPLLYAACNKDKSILRLMMQKSKQVELPITAVEKVLLSAASLDDQEAVALLLATPDIHADATDEDGATSLMRAAYGGSPGTIRLLLASGANVNTKDERGQCPLHYAVRTSFSRVEKIKTLLEIGKADIDSYDLRGMTPLMSAVESTSIDAPELDAAELLLSAGANVNASDIHGNTLTHYAMSSFTHRLERMIEFLCTWKADLSAQNKHGMTPLMDAAQKLHYTTVDMLLHHITSAHTSNVEDTTALYSDASSHREDAVTPASSSCRHESTSSFVNKKDKGGATALAWAMAENIWSPHMLKTIKLLLEHGAFVNFAYRPGEQNPYNIGATPVYASTWTTPLERAGALGNVHLIEMLLKYGADASFRPSDVDIEPLMTPLTS